MKLGDKIVSAEESIQDMKEQVAEITQKALDDNRDLSEDEVAQIDGLEGNIEAAELSLKGLKKAEKALGQKTAERDAAKERRVPTIPAAVKADEKSSDILFKMAHVSLRAHLEKKDPLAIASERYGHDPRVLEVTKSATTPAYTSAAGWAQELTDTAMVGFIEELQADGVYGKLAARGIALPFGTNNAITMPRRNGKGHVSGSFVGEGATIPVKMDSYGSVTFNRYKAAVITAMSKEITRVSNPAIEGLLRTHIVQDTNDMLDGIILDPTVAAVAGIRPASPWNGAVNQASAGDTLANILTDLQYLINTLSNANAGRAPVLIMHPSRALALGLLTNANGAFVFRSEIASGSLLGVPLITSTNCPNDHVFIMDSVDFGTAFGTPEFDVSEQATVVMADDDGTDPTMAATNAVSTAGSLQVSDAAGTTPPTVVRSMYQTWEMALRMVMPVSWGMLRTNTVAYITGVSW